MSADVVIDKVIALVAEELGVEPGQLPHDATLNVYERWDSLNHISIILALEEEFGVEVNEDTIRQLNSIPAIMKHLQKRTA
jgi:acyl carrier protein